MPKLKRKKKKSILAVDELSTVGKKVSVYRCGKVVVHDSGSDEDSNEEREDVIE